MVPLISKQCVICYLRNSYKLCLNFLNDNFHKQTLKLPLSKVYKFNKHCLIYFSKIRGNYLDENHEIISPQKFLCNKILIYFQKTCWVIGIKYYFESKSVYKIFKS